MSASKKLFYGWVIVAAGMIVTGLGLGMFYSTNSVFLKPVCADLGFTRAEFSFHRTIITLVSGFTLPLYERMAFKFGIKRLFIAGAVMLSLASFGFSLSRNLWEFYASAALNGLFYNSTGFMLVGLLLSKWFEGKRGVAMGLAYSGSGLGGAIMIPLVGWIVEKVNWRFAYQFMGVVGLAVLLPAILILVKNSPQDMGLEPLAPDSSEKKATGGILPSYTFRRALSTGEFWMMFTALFLLSFFAGCVNTHSTPYLSDLGYSSAHVSAIIAIFMIFASVGKIILGWLYDHLGTMAGNAVLSFFCLGYPILALLSVFPTATWFYGVFVGVASCGMSVSVVVLVTRYFGNESFSKIFSLCSMATGLAPSISIPVMGAIFDSTGSYRDAWIGLFFVSVVITLCLLGAEWKNRQELRALKEKSV